MVRLTMRRKSRPKRSISPSDGSIAAHPGAPDDQQQRGADGYPDQLPAVAAENSPWCQLPGGHLCREAKQRRKGQRRAQGLQWSRQQRDWHSRPTQQKDQGIAQPGDAVRLLGPESGEREQCDKEKAQRSRQQERRRG